MLADPSVDRSGLARLSAWSVRHPEAADPQSIMNLVPQVHAKFVRSREAHILSVIY
jgi:uncharacterized protein YciI